MGGRNQALELKLVFNREALAVLPKTGPWRLSQTTLSAWLMV
jgi:hypothetical protein